MKGYLNNPRPRRRPSTTMVGSTPATSATSTRTAHLFVVDRLKELIKYKGFQVPPAELEALLLTHPAVADAAVIGEPDDEAGEIPVGFVALKPDECRRPEGTSSSSSPPVSPRTSRFGRSIFVDEIPKSASGKILRRILRETFAQRR